MAKKFVDTINHQTCMSYSIIHFSETTSYKIWRASVGVCAYLWGQVLMLAYNQRSNSSQNVFSRVRVRALCRTLEFLHTKLAHHVFMELFSRVELGASFRILEFLHTKLVKPYPYSDVCWEDLAHHWSSNSSQRVFSRVGVRDLCRTLKLLQPRTQQTMSLWNWLYSSGKAFQKILEYICGTLSPISQNNFF